MADKQNDHEGHRARLRSRYLKAGLEGFHDYEVLELILTFAQVRRDTKPLAKRLLEKYKGLSNVLNAPVEDLCMVEGMGATTAVLLRLFRDVELYDKKTSVMDNLIQYGQVKEKTIVNDADDIYRYITNYLGDYYRGKKVEIFSIFYLNSNNVVVKEEQVEGSVSETTIYVRQIVQKALTQQAASVLIAHNHPSGSLKPSQADIQLTRRLRESLSMMDIRLLDHVIFGEGKFVSLRKEGYLGT